MGLEDIFQQSVGDWKEHCRKNSHHSFYESYLDCDAYRKIVFLGPRALPLIRDQLNKEYEIAMNYESEFKRIKKRIFGDENIFLYGETYDRACEDEEFKKYYKGYYQDVFGNPGVLWSVAISDIIPDFNLPVGEENSGEAVEKARSGFVKLHIYEVQRQTIEWLDKNMHKYLPTNVV